MRGNKQQCKQYAFLAENQRIQKHRWHLVWLCKICQTHPMQYYRYKSSTNIQYKNYPYVASSGGFALSFIQGFRERGLKLPCPCCYMHYKRLFNMDSIIFNASFITLNYERLSGGIFLKHQIYSGKRSIDISPSKIYTGSKSSHLPLLISIINPQCITSGLPA